MEPPATNNMQISEFERSGWAFVVTQSHILDSKCKTGEGAGCSCKFCFFTAELSSYSHWPEMIFADNTLTITHHKSNATLYFCALDALKCINTVMADKFIKVAASKDWMEARKDVLDSNLFETGKEYDWTYSTEYKGSINNFEISNCTEGIDLDKLRVHEPILFFNELVLYEDELDDNGAASLKLKFRVMPSGFFVLLRFYLRVDLVHLRIIDTRIHWEASNPYLVREFTYREAPYSDLSQEMKDSVFDMNKLWDDLPLITKECQKLSFHSV